MLLLELMELQRLTTSTTKQQDGPMCVVIDHTWATGGPGATCQMEKLKNSKSSLTVWMSLADEGRMRVWVAKYTTTWLDLDIKVFDNHYNRCAFYLRIFNQPVSQYFARTHFVMSFHSPSLSNGQTFRAILSLSGRKIHISAFLSSISHKCSKIVGRKTACHIACRQAVA